MLSFGATDWFALSQDAKCGNANLNSHNLRIHHQIPLRGGGNFLCKSKELFVYVFVIRLKATRGKRDQFCKLTVSIYMLPLLQDV